MSDKPKRIDPIPDEFSSYEEAAEFWDSHDLTDFEADLEEVPELVFERKPASGKKDKRVGTRTPGKLSS